ncbi:MAG TPA: phosphoribosylglycinamide formyltransferase [Ktedonobacteraceae bacterium]|nr:phosphoribosylglycinamide formyltransferase [Ktedonobacteraceae bacterium]
MSADTADTYESFAWKIPLKRHASGKPEETPETPQHSLRLGVLISGSGSNLQALIDAIENKQLPEVEIALVVSNNANAYGVQRALKHNVPVIYLPWVRLAGAQFIVPQKGEMSENEVKLTALLQLFKVDLIVLAGWMRILSATFLEQFPRQVINLHPALLPDDGTGHIYTTQDGTQIRVFRGLHAVKQALDAGVKVTGSTVHYVTPEVDAGPVICREEVAIVPGDTEESLHTRLKMVEHRLIVEAVRMCKSKI